MNSFQIIPAIDLKDGALLRGNPDLDPVQQAKVFVQQGAEHLHVVDLNGAIHGEPTNFLLIQDIIRTSGAKAQVSAGIDTPEKAENFHGLNVWQMILASNTIHTLSFVEDVVDRWGPENITLALDWKDGNLVSRSHEKLKPLPFRRVEKKLAELEIKRYIVTDVSRDGSLSGANWETAQTIKDSLQAPQVLVSGGVQSEEEVLKIKEAGLDGVVIGTALYEGRIDLSSLFRRIQG